MQQSSSWKACTSIAGRSASRAAAVFYEWMKINIQKAIILFKANKMTILMEEIVVKIPKGLPRTIFKEKDR